MSENLQDTEATEDEKLKGGKPKKKRKANDKRHAGCLTIRTGNQTMAEAAKLPRPKVLYPHLVFEGECSCLFSDTNTGKSIFAVQMGCEIAKEHGLTVAYYDFELSMTQFRARYSDYNGWYMFPDNFYRIEISATSFVSPNILEDIEEAANKIEAKVLIIDNITWLCADGEEGASASMFMKSIKRLQRKYGWTIIVIAHTPKRNDAYPITVNDLAGSKQFANFFDSIFALGRCNTIKNVRYLKQVKVRAEETAYSADSILVLAVEKGEDHMLKMVQQGTENEKMMLFDDEQLEEERFNEVIRDMAEIGASDKEIVAQTGESMAKVKKLTRYIRAKQHAITDSVGPSVEDLKRDEEELKEFNRRKKAEREAEASGKDNEDA